MKKSDFVKALLAEKNLRSQDREKILELSAFELSLNKNKIENELNSFKKTLSALKEENKKDINEIQDELKSIKQNIEKKYNTIHKEPNPKHVADFMSLFNQREGLKYLTHDFDEDSEFEFDKFLIDAKKVFDERTTKAGLLKLNIPSSLWKIVQQFAFNGKTQPEWTTISDDYKIEITRKIGWASKELRKWSKVNKAHPIANIEYNEIIKDFKRITRIKEPELEILIKSTLEKVFGDNLPTYNISHNAVAKADFYTHVLFLQKAMEKIFEMIKEEAHKSNCKQIKIEYQRGQTLDGYYFRKILINHVNSFPVGKELELLLNEWTSGKGGMGFVQKKLNGYCHWSIESIIDNKPMRINILKEATIPSIVYLDNTVDGFVHDLTFYYK